MNSGEFAHLERLSRADRCPGRDECQADKTLTHLPRDSAGGSAPGTAPLAHDARLTGSSGERNSGPTKICFPVSSGEETFSATPLAGNRETHPTVFWGTAALGRAGASSLDSFTFGHLLVDNFPKTVHFSFTYCGPSRRVKAAARVTTQFSDVTRMFLEGGI